MFGFLFGKKKKATSASGQPLIPMTHEVAMTVINEKTVTVVKAPFTATQTDDIARVAMRYYLRAFPNTIPVMLTFDPMDPDQRAIFIGPREFTDALKDRQINDFRFGEVKVEVPFIPWFIKEDLDKKASDGEAAEWKAEDKKEK